MMRLYNAEFNYEERCLIFLPKLEGVTENELSQEPWYRLENMQDVNMDELEERGDELLHHLEGLIDSLCHPALTRAAHFRFHPEEAVLMQDRLEEQIRTALMGFNRYTDLLWARQEAMERPPRE